MTSEPTHQPDHGFKPALTLVLGVVVVVAIILVARQVFGVSEAGVKEMLSSLSGSPWALPIVILLFTVAAFIGVPQWLLIGATVFAFGPVYGAAYSWLATIISACVDFTLGRVLGEKRLARLRTQWVQRFVTRIKSNGFWVSFGVRLVPSGPFVLVNMAAGMSGMKFRNFFAGTGLGIIPKIAAIAFLGQSLMAALSGDPLKIALAFGGFLAVVIAGYFLARSRYAKRAKISEKQT